LRDVGVRIADGSDEQVWLFDRGHRDLISLSSELWPRPRAGPSRRPRMKVANRFDRPTGAEDQLEILILAVVVEIDPQHIITRPSLRRAPF